VGKAVNGRRDKVFLASKCGRTWDTEGNNYNNLRPESMRKEIDDTLRRLEVDYLDLYQIHWPDIATGTPLEESWGVMKEIKDSGKARFIGVSNFNIEQLETCMEIEHVQSLQPPFNMIRKDVEKDLLPWCEKNGVGVVAYSPMQSGLLTGKFDLDSLAEDDWRRNSLIFQEPNLSNNLKLVEDLRPIAEKYNKTVGQLAVAWVLSNSATTSAIVGARNENQATQNIEGDFIIEDDDLKKIRELLDNMPEATIGRI
jgi:aryl-alcohol dehydrogenase-like predicted oxidoreductase